GTCAWSSAYSLVFDSGTQMAGSSPVNLPKSVAPGQTVDLAATLAAPSEPGHYRGFWKLGDASGNRFGLGVNGDTAFWVDVVVQDSSIVAYDLVAFAPYAQWKSGAGPLPYPGTSGDARGYAQRLDYLVTEDGAFTSAPSLVTVPQTKTDGNIQAVYPAFTVQKGDRFQAMVGCEYGSACYVTYRLDYINSANVTRSFWTRREMNDGRVYQADVDLSPLAGQNVRFVLTLLATGSPTGDRAIWGAPRIARTIPPATPVPPLEPPGQTPTPTPFGSPPAIVPSACDKAAFVVDVTVPDGTLFAPGAAFTKTWRLKNTGKCTWTTSYKAFFYTGEQMGSPTAVDMPRAVRPGESLDLTVNMVAPQAPGLHRGDWVLSNADGVLFGTGSPAVNTFWLQINVAGDTGLGHGYDFSANACSAQWRNGSVQLPCPGTDGDANGFVIRQDTPHLEDGTFATLPGLLVAPRNKFDGYIQGIYPAFTVQPGDRFQAMIGCEFGANCYVTFRLDYMNASGTVRTLASWRERNEARFFNVDQDLSSLAGQSVRFILTLSAAGLPAGDRAIWGAPHIQPRVVVLPSTPTPTPSPTLPPPGDDWLTYTNAPNGFLFRYPAQGVISGQTDDSARIDLPFMPGTNLHQKWMQFQVFPNPGTCREPFTNFSVPPYPTETVVINGISFLKEAWPDGVTGQLYDWTAYTTQNGNNCLSFGFVLHSINRGAIDTPPPEFDKAAESIVFGQILHTFTWSIITNPSITPTPTSPPIGEGWVTGHVDHIAFKYPDGSQIVDQTNTHLRIQLPIISGTN
ncbi:MAG TPA: NBR1-Ig-like domain-containing protein, partial [Anaerolineales bacterium]